MVVHYTPLPALVVPYPLLAAETAALAGGPVVVGWDGSTGAGLACATAGRLFPARELLLVSADRAVPEPDATDRQVNLVHLDGVSHGSSPAVAEALVAYARTRSAAVVVVGSRGRSVVREVLLGSVARATLHQSHGPVLVVPHVDDPPARGTVL